MATPAGQLADRYLKDQVETASPEQILLLLYDGAIKFLRIARNALLAEEWEKSHHNLIKTQNILLELMTSLNMEVGGDMARNLYRLYDYYIWSLVQANIHRDVNRVDEVITHLKNLKQTWEQAIIAAAQELTTSAPPISRPGSESSHTAIISA
jgi:flagellar secretion chaperone FliS